MDDDKVSRVARLVEQLHDKVDEFIRDTHDHREMHEKEHRAHDKEHSVIGQWQVSTDERLRQGAGAMAEARAGLVAVKETVDERTAPPRWPAVAAAVIAAVGMPVAAVIWIANGLDAKADKAAFEAKIESKADKADMVKLGEKIDRLLEKLDTTRGR